MSGQIAAGAGIPPFIAPTGADGRSACQTCRAADQASGDIKRHAMRTLVQTVDGIVIVSVAGAVDSHAAGHLYDVLVGCTGEGRTKLIVGLSGVHLMTRAGVRGLVVAAKLMQQARGEMRICGAQPPIEAFLQSLGLDHLLKCDPTLQSSIARLRDGEHRKSKAPVAVVPFGAPAATQRPEQYPAGAEDSGEHTVIWRRES